MDDHNTSKSEMLALIADQRFWRGSMPWVLALLVAANLAVQRWNTALVEQRRQNLLAADPAPAGAVPQADGSSTAPVRFDRSVGERPEAYWPYIPDAGVQPLVILCGMSQMYAINQREPGDQTISEWMDDALAPQGARVFGLAAPNLTNEEALLLLLASLSQRSTTPRAFIFAACFDKFRNVDLRPGYWAFLRAKPELQQPWEAVARQYDRHYPLAAQKMLRTLASIRSAEGKQQESFESRLRTWVGRFVPAVEARKELNGKFQLYLYSFRNTLLGITNTSKRPIIQARYDMNREFLGMMADVARQRNVHFITYVIPLNPSSENPYILEEYEGFKRWLEGFARQKDVPFANLENIVPSEEWGMFMGGPDFKHFKGSGHRRSARSLLEHFGPWLTHPGTERKPG